MIILASILSGLNNIVEMALKSLHIRKKVWLFKKEVFQNDNLMEAKCLYVIGKTKRLYIIGKSCDISLKIIYLKTEGIITHSEQ